MYTPPVIVMDYETALTDGTPSVDYYREDFRVISAAFAWRRADGEIRTHCTQGEYDTSFFLSKIEGAGIPVCVHNYQFEYGVSLYRFPDFEKAISLDTMRLVQVADNGGRMAAYNPKIETYDDLLDSAEGGDGSSYTTGLALVAAASRWLPAEWQDHKAPYHAWLRDNAGVKKGHEGQHLTSLPAEMLEAYNVADAKVTLLLYETLTKEFLVQGYDPTMDHELYKSTARMVATAKGTGLRVDSAALAEYVSRVEAEVDEIEGKFRQRFLEQIIHLETLRHFEYIKGVKTERARERRSKQPIEYFNIGSNKQLKELFVDTLGITPKFWTKAPYKRKPGAKEFVPSPSFKASHLATYGDGGELLKARRKRLLVLQQAKALLKLSSFDGRWHLDTRACGTATGRLAGGRHE